MHVVIAPDKFKGTLSASEAADAMAKGVRNEIRHASIILRPVADGGEGTVDALLLAHGGRVSARRVSGPLPGHPVNAPLAHLADGSCALEMSGAAGLALVDDDRRDALAASSEGLGQLIAAALQESSRRIVVGVGGSASSDGGTGAARALGWRFLDAAGKDLPLGGGSLRRLAHIDGSGVSSELAGATIAAACDVDNPLLGEYGAARVFAPQKGASDEDVEVLEEGLARLSERIASDLGIDVATLPGGGAGGGTGAGLVAFFGAVPGDGFEVVAEATNLRDAIEEADLVVTGEGRLDEQSLAGKAPVGVARMARDAGVRCFAVAGEVPIDPRSLKAEGIVATASMIEVVGRERAWADAAGALTATTRALVRSRVTEGSDGPRRFFRT